MAVLMASDAIKRLAELMDEYGDLPIRHGERCGDVTAESIEVYSDDGNHPVAASDACEFYIH